MKKILLSLVLLNGCHTTSYFGYSQDQWATLSSSQRFTAIQQENERRAKCAEPRVVGVRKSEWHHITNRPKFIQDFYENQAFAIKGELSHKNAMLENEYFHLKDQKKSVRRDYLDKEYFHHRILPPRKRSKVIKIEGF